MPMGLLQWNLVNLALIASNVSACYKRRKTAVSSFSSFIDFPVIES
jgi:hypothetical protein